jgi:Zn-dependent protease with chaperone function
MTKYYFYDGKSAKRHNIALSLSVSGFTIRSETGDRLAYWTYAECEIVEEDSAQDFIRILNKKQFGARLVVEGAEALKLGAAIRKASANHKTLRPIHLLFALPMLVVAGLVGFMLYGPPVADHLLSLVPYSYDQRFGELIFEELRDELEFCDNKAAEAALQKIVKRLTVAADSDFTFTVRVANSADVNAFALPGGHIVFFNGLIQKAESPEEVAGVLAHEMSHVIKRHSMAGMAKQLGLQFLLFAGTGDTNSVITYGNYLLSMSMSRTAEAEADALGAELLANAGISVSGLKSFFARGSNGKDEHAIFELTRTHPFDDKRVNALSDPAGLKPKRVLSQKEWKALKNFCPTPPKEDDDDDEDWF